MATRTGRFVPTVRVVSLCAFSLSLPSLLFFSKVPQETNRLRASYTCLCCGSVRETDKKRHIQNLHHDRGSYPHHAPPATRCVIDRASSSVVVVVVFAYHPPPFADCALPSGAQNRIYDREGYLRTSLTTPARTSFFFAFFFVLFLLFFIIPPVQVICMWFFPPYFNAAFKSYVCISLLCVICTSSPGRAFLLFFIFCMTMSLPSPQSPQGRQRNNPLPSVLVWGRERGSKFC